MTQEIQKQENSLTLSLNKTALAEMGEQRNLLAAFVRDQLKENVDFGIIPGVKTNSLWKPGAEKIANIFQLGSSVLDIEKEIDFEKNIAIITVKIGIFHIPTGRAIAQCMAICTSMETKFRERNIYEWVAGKRTVVDKVKTPIGDVLNTLIKMAIKRAYVGGVIMATGASDFYTMDVDEDNELYDPNYREPTNGTPPNTQDKPYENKIKTTITPVAAKPEVLPPKNDGRTEVNKGINVQRARLKWSGDQLANFIKEQFQSTPAQLSFEQMVLCLETMEKMK